MDKNMTKVIRHPFTKTEKAVYNSDRWRQFHERTKNRYIDTDSIRLQSIYDEEDKKLFEKIHKQVMQACCVPKSIVITTSGLKDSPMDQMIRKYINYDIEATREFVEHLKVNPNIQKKPELPKIKNVIFNDPATIVFWADGSKTVVKAQDGETYDPEKGLAMAISKKALGNTREYYHTFAKQLKKVGKKERSDI